MSSILIMAFDATRSGLGGHIDQRLLGYGCVLFRWRDQDKDARHLTRL